MTNSNILYLSAPRPIPYPVPKTQLFGRDTNSAIEKLANDESLQLPVPLTWCSGPPHLFACVARRAAIGSISDVDRPE